MKKPSKAVLRLPLHKRAEIAFKIAVAKAIDEHARLGLPIYVWRDGRVIELPPDEVRNISESNGKHMAHRVRSV
jgi:hypothetical protein